MNSGKHLKRRERSQAHEFLNFIAYAQTTSLGGGTMEPKEFAQFMHFLQDDLAIPDGHLQLALRHPEQTPSLLPMILWQYGLVTLTQVNQIFDWLEHRISG